jgi:hypothetical protein
MKSTFTKIKTEHHILKEFHKMLQEIEKHPAIHRIIPGRIDRQQKKSSIERFRISYPTAQWLKCIMSKWSTAQELFIISDSSNYDTIVDHIQTILTKYKL